MPNPDTTKLVDPDEVKATYDIQTQSAEGGGDSSTRTSKKIMAVFTLDNGRTRTVHFGSAGASDYTQHRDPVRKQRYLARHAPREDWDNPMTAGALSRWVLWNKETFK